MRMQTSLMLAAMVLMASSATVSGADLVWHPVAWADPSNATIGYRRIAPMFTDCASKPISRQRSMCSAMATRILTATCTMRTAT